MPALEQSTLPWPERSSVLSHCSTVDTMTPDILHHTVMSSVDLSMLSRVAFETPLAKTVHPVQLSSSALEGQRNLLGP